MQIVVNRQIKNVAINTAINIAPLVAVVILVLCSCHIVFAAKLDKVGSPPCRLFLSHINAHALDVKTQQHWKYILGTDEVQSRFTITSKSKSYKSGVQSSSQAVLVKTDRMDIPTLMSDFKLSYFEAVEVQAQVRIHRSRSDEEFFAVVKNVKSGKFISGLNSKKIKQATAVIAFDFDGVLVDQDSRWSDEISSFKYIDSESGRERAVAVASWALELIKKLNELGLAVVIYSRNSDSLIHALTEFITIDGKPLSHMVDGILTSSFLTVPEGTAQDEIDFSKPYVKKDLRTLDRSKTIIIDDDTEHINEEDHARTRKVKSFEVDKMAGRNSRSAEYGLSRFEKPKEINEKKLVKESVQKMRSKYDEIFIEIEESLFFAKENKVSFAAAYFPYSVIGEKLGKIMVASDTEAKTLMQLKVVRVENEKEAQDWLRLNEKAAFAAAIRLMALEKIKAKELAKIKEKELENIRYGSRGFLE